MLRLETNMASSWNTGTAVSKVSEVAENVGQKIVDNNQTIKAVSSVASAASSAASAVSSSLPTWQSVVDTAAEAMEGVSGRWTDVAGKAYELLPEAEDVAEVFKNNKSKIKVGVISPFAVNKAVKALKPFTELVTSTPAEFFIKDITGWGKGEVLDQTSLTNEELDVYKALWNKKGAGQVVRGDYGIDSKSDPLQVRSGKDGSMLGLPANVSSYFSLGDTSLIKNEAGEVLVKDTYDYNFYTDYGAEPDANNKYPIVSTEDFEENFSTAEGISETLLAVASGKIGKLSALHNIGFLLGSRQYLDSSKNEGSPILINLGKPEDWD